MTELKHENAQLWKKNTLLCIGKTRAASKKGLLTKCSSIKFLALSLFNTGVSQPCKRRQVETTGVPRWLLHYIQLRNVWHHRIFCCYKPTSGLHHGGWWHSSPVQCRWEDSEHHDSDFVLRSKNGGRWAGSKMVRGLQKQHRKSFPASTIGTINRVFSYVACFHILQHMWPSSFRFTLYCIFMQKMFPSPMRKSYELWLLK